jgi:hypothetical protein
VAAGHLDAIGVRNHLTLPGDHAPRDAGRACSVISMRRSSRASPPSTEISAARASHSTRAIPRSSMTVEQLISDLDEPIDGVCERLGKTTLGIFGHPGTLPSVCCTPPHFPARSPPTSAAGRSATGRRPRRPHIGSRSPQRSASAVSGGEEAAGDRPAAIPGRGRGHGAQVAVALRRPDESSSPVECGTNRSRRTGVVNPRAAQRLARVRVLMNAIGQRSRA